MGVCSKTNSPGWIKVFNLSKECIKIKHTPDSEDYRLSEIELKDVTINQNHTERKMNDLRVSA